MQLLGSWLQVWLQSIVHIKSISLFISLVRSLSDLGMERYIQPPGKSLMDLALKMNREKTVKEQRN